MHILIHLTNESSEILDTTKEWLSELKKNPKEISQNTTQNLGIFRFIAFVIDLSFSEIHV